MTSFHRALAVLALVSSGAASAQPVYTWTDEHGEVHYSNEPGPQQHSGSRVVLPDDSAAAPVEQSAEQPARPSESADPRREAEVLAGIQRHAWSASDVQVHDAAYGPAFLHLADTSGDPVVITAALKAIATLYSPNPAGGATFNGKRFERLQSSDETYRVALKHLGHPDFHVRIAAAQLAGLGAWGPNPSPAVIQALGDRVTREPNAHVLDFVGGALWECHCARPEMVDAAMSLLERGDPRSAYSGLSLMSRVGSKGRDFDAPSRQRMHHAAARFLSSDEPVVRASAITAWQLTATEDVDAVVQALAHESVTGHALGRFTAVAALGRADSLDAVPPILAALSDTAMAEAKAHDDLPGFRMATVAQVALESLASLTGRVLGRPAFTFEAPKQPLEGAALTKEVERARAWARANAKLLKLAQPAD